MDPYVAGGSGLLALTLIGTLVRLIVKDNVWRDLYKERTEQYADCRAEIAARDVLIQNLQGEVISLRGFTHDRRFKPALEERQHRMAGGMEPIEVDDES